MPTEPNDQNVFEQSDDLADDRVMPLPAGDFADENFDPLAGAGHTREVKSGTMLIVIVVVVAAAGLFSLRTLAKITAAVAGESDLEVTVEQFLRRLGGGGEGDSSPTSVLTRHETGPLMVLNESYHERQVPLANVQRNPFILFSEGATPTTTTTPIDPHAAERAIQKQRQERRDEMSSAARRIVIKSILLGRDPLVNLNDQIVGVDDVVMVTPENIEFTVTAITGNTVTIAAEDLALSIDEEFVLELRRDE